MVVSPAGVLNSNYLPLFTYATVSFSELLLAETVEIFHSMIYIFGVLLSPDPECTIDR